MLRSIRLPTLVAVAPVLVIPPARVASGTRPLKRRAVFENAP